MAAAIAASLPAPQAASAPTAPVHEPIPASMSKLIDIEGEIPLSLVQLEGLVCTVLGRPHLLDTDFHPVGRFENNQTELGVTLSGPWLTSRTGPRWRFRGDKFFPFATHFGRRR